MHRLLIRPGAIGDLIVSLPALESLRADDTEAWVAEQNVPLVRFAERVCPIQSTGLNLLEIPGQQPAVVLDRLRRFDSIISWYGSARAEFQERVRQHGLRFRFLSALPSGMHAVDFYLEQARAAGGRPVSPVPRIQCPHAPGQYAVIHPFSGSRRKNWPLERFRELAARLERHVRVEWCAGPEELLDGARRFENLYELACWLAGARLYIGNDSGITHLAAAAAAPVVALFGPTDPAVWAPRGDRVRVLHRDPITEIRLEEVWQAASMW